VITTFTRLLSSVTPAQSQLGRDKPWFVRVLEDTTVFLRDLLEHALPVVEVVAVAGAVLGGLYLATRLARLRARHRLARQGTRFEIALPEEPDREALVNFFRSLALLLRPRLLSPAPWIGFAFVSEGLRLRLELFCSGGVPAEHIKGALEQSLSGAGIERLLRPKLTPLPGGHASSCSLAAADMPALPLETRHASAPSRMVLAALAGQSAAEGAVVQLLLRPAPAAMRRRSLARARKLRRGGPRSLWPAPARFGAELATEAIDILVPGAPPRGGSAPSHAVPPDPWAVERAKLIEEKSAEPFLAASLRLAAFADERSRARARRDFLAATFAPFHGRVGLRHKPEPFFWRRLHAWLPPLRARLLLTPPEAAALLPIPERAAEAPLSLAEPPARRMASVSEAPRTGIVVGQADREGFSEKLVVAPEALLQHAHILGPTGRGKSTWLLNLALAWIRAGYGLVLLDPKRDLVQALLRRMPASRVDDVELLDLGDESHPPALNLLACRLEEADLHVEALAGIFRRLFTRFWGPRSEDILRAALATLLTGGRTGAPAPTLADVLALLTDPAERGRYSVRDPVALAQFWRQWNEFSSGQREQALAPLSNKLRAFLSQRQLRNVLCQPEAPDFEQIVADGRILVCSLPKGVLGPDAASLIGSVITYRLWHAAMRLGPTTDRPPFLCLIDEFHQFCHLPQGLAEALAEARGYRLGFVLAHQHLGQLDDRELLEAVDANCQTKICFGLPPGDSKRMARHFAPRLDEYDLEHLGPFQIACRIAHGGRQLPAATATTLPLPDYAAGNPEFTIRRRTEACARTRSDVEALLAKQFGREDEPPPGRAEADDPSPPGSPPGSPPDGGPPRGRDPHGGGDRGDSADPDDDNRDAA
jgi:hypothetical protein